jgi:DegV family protein with EDD domain
MAVFAALEAFGRLEGRKSDDMELQRRIAAAAGRKCLVLVDSTSDIPDDLRLELLIERIPVQVSVGDATFSDGDGISTSGFYEVMRRHPESLPSSSQPTRSAYLRKMDFLLSHAEGVAYVSLSGALSGTYEGALRAAKDSRDPSRLRILDSKAISVPCGIVAHKAAVAAAGGASLDEVEALVRDLVPRTRVLVTVPTLDNLVRSGRLGKGKKLLADALGLRPLITITAEGKADTDSYYLGASSGTKKLVARMGRILAESGGGGAGPSGKPRVEGAWVGHIGNPKGAEELLGMLRESFEVEGEIRVVELSPVLAIHVGPGSVAAAFVTHGPRTP